MFVILHKFISRGISMQVQQFTFLSKLSRMNSYNVPNDFKRIEQYGKNSRWPGVIVVSFHFSDLLTCYFNSQGTQNGVGKFREQLFRNYEFPFFSSKHFECIVHVIVSFNSNYRFCVLFIFFDLERRFRCTRLLFYEYSSPPPSL